MNTNKPSILARNAAGASLSPLERASLKLGKALILAGVVAMGAVISQAVVTGHIVDSTVVYSGAMAGAYAVLAGLSKFFSAIGDPQLAQVSSEGQAVAQAEYHKVTGGMNVDAVASVPDVSENVAEYEDAIGPALPVEAPVVPVVNATPAPVVTEVSNVPAPEVVSNVTFNAAPVQAS